MSTVSKSTEPTTVGETFPENDQSTTITPPVTFRNYLRMLMVLFKMRIVVLLLMAATGGAFMAAEGWPGWSTLVLVWVTGGMAAAGSSSFNQYLERNKDDKMGRTMKKRPLVNGEIPES